jgi:hypothetical protein
MIYSCIFVIDSGTKGVHQLEYGAVLLELVFYSLADIL